ncbi:MAG: APC family permease [Bryobacteraceae bacterium]|nr:APC family permease [Bryobacteraceae bacterium]
MPDGQRPGLTRQLGLRDLVFFNVSATISFRWLAVAAHNGPGSLVLWALGAAFFFVPLALVIARLTERFPQEGGFYVWTRQAFGDWHGFLCGWAYWLSNFIYFPSLLVFAGAMVLGEAGGPVFAFGVAVFWGASIALMVSPKAVRWIAAAGGACTYLSAALLLVLAAAAGARRFSGTAFDLVPSLELSKLALWPQLAFGFQGIELGAVMAEEIRDPKRTIGRAALIAGAAIGGFYIAGTAAILTVLRPEQISPVSGLSQISRAIGDALGSPLAGDALLWLMLAALFGQLCSWILGNSRLPFVIGLDRYLPPAFGRLHPRWGTPWVSLLAQAAGGTLLALGLSAGETLRGTYYLLVDMTALLVFLPFLYLFAAAWKFGERIPAACGLAVTSIAIALSLAPPPETRAVWLFEAKLLGGCALVVLAGFANYRYARSVTGR